MPPMKPFRIGKQTGPKEKNKGPRQSKSSSSKGTRNDGDFFLDDDGPSNLNDKQKPRTSHPPHLKGKEIGLWYSRKQASMREDEEMLDMTRPKLKPPPNLRGRELDQWHKEQNRLWQKNKEKRTTKRIWKMFYQIKNRRDWSYGNRVPKT